MGTPYKGVLYAGLMLTADGPKLIEYNVRFGDPESQVLMLRLMSDLVPALLACRDGMLKSFDLRWYPDAALTVVMAARVIRALTPRAPSSGPDDAAAVEGVEIFHAGTRRKVAASWPMADACSTSRRSARMSARRRRAPTRPSPASVGLKDSIATTSAGALSSGKKLNRGPKRNFAQRVIYFLFMLYIGEMMGVIIKNRGYRGQNSQARRANW